MSAAMAETVRPHDRRVGAAFRVDLECVALSAAGRAFGGI